LVLGVLSGIDVLLLEESFGFFKLLGFVHSLLLILHSFEGSSLVLRSEHVLRSSGRVLNGFGLFASVALLAPLEVVVLALRTLPTTIRKLKAIVIGICFLFHYVSCLPVLILQINIILRYF